MRGSPFITVGTAATSNDAEIMAATLRHAGIHPADLALIAPLPMDGVKISRQILSIERDQHSSR